MLQRAERTEGCSADGIPYQWGVDADGNGRLEGSEVSGTTVVCKTGSNLAMVVPEGPGVFCHFGGRKLVTGMDVNRDGKLQPEEIQQTSVTCNGPGGKLGALAIVSSATPGAIANEVTSAPKLPLPKTLLEQAAPVNAQNAASVASVPSAVAEESIPNTRAVESEPGSAPANLAGLLGSTTGSGPSDGPSPVTKPSPSGGPNQADLEATVRAYQAGLKRKCWDTTQGITGVNAMASISLAPDGSVENVSVTANEPAVGRCIEQQIARWTFPAGTRSQVNVPFKFVRQ